MNRFKDKDPKNTIKPAAEQVQSNEPSGQAFMPPPLQFSSKGLDPTSAEKEESDQPGMFNTKEYATGAAMPNDSSPSQMSSSNNLQANQSLPTVQRKKKANDAISHAREAELVSEYALNHPLQAYGGVFEGGLTAKTIQRDKTEVENDMQPLGSAKESGIMSRRKIYLTDANKSVKRTRLNRPKTENLTTGQKISVIESVTNPAGLPAGDYYFAKIQKIEIQGKDNIAAPLKHGFILKTDVNASATYKDINTIQGDGPKVGKILPDAQAAISGQNPEIGPTDVYQSGISDCYLHASLIAIAATNAGRTRLKSLFTIRQNDLDVSFRAYTTLYPFNKRFEATTITMSKKLFLNDDGTPIYGGKKDAYLWPAFIQKAYAIYKGKYSDLPMGKPRDIIGKILGIDLGEKSTDEANYDAKSQWEFYNSLVAALNNGFPAILATGTWTDAQRRYGRTKETYPQKDNNRGLGIKHSYAILNVQPADLQRPGDNPDAKPEGVNLTLQDPRNEAGGTITLPFKYALDERKVEGFYIGYNPT